MSRVRGGEEREARLIACAAAARDAWWVRIPLRMDAPDDIIRWRSPGWSRAMLLQSFNVAMIAINLVTFSSLPGSSQSLDPEQLHLEAANDFFSYLGIAASFAILTLGWSSAGGLRGRIVYVALCVLGASVAYGTLS